MCRWHLRKKEIGKIKDKYRMPYGKHIEEHKFVTEVFIIGDQECFEVPTEVKGTSALTNPLNCTKTS